MPKIKGRTWLVRYYSSKLECISRMTYVCSVMWKMSWIEFLHCTFSLICLMFVLQHLTNNTTGRKRGGFDFCWTLVPLTVLLLLTSYLHYCQRWQPNAVWWQPKLRSVIREAEPACLVFNTHRWQTLHVTSSLLSVYNAQKCSTKTVHYILSWS